MTIILICALAGICGTSLGCLLLILIGKGPAGSMGWSLSFAGGVMISLVCFGLIPEAVELSGIPATAGGLAIGLVVILAVDLLVDKLTGHGSGHHGAGHEHSHSMGNDIAHEESRTADPRSLIRSGTIMLVAIGLHNIPEGMAIGAGGHHDLQLGTMLAAMIALHNIPTGMAIAAPLLAGGMGKARTLFLVILSGLPTLFGGLIGMAIGDISDLAVALSLAGAGGTLMYVVLKEIIPQSVSLIKIRLTSLMILLGILAGLLAMSLQ